MEAYPRPVPLSPEQQRSIADLVSQVNVDNVLQVAAHLQQQADTIQDALNAASPSLVLEPCGDDPVSRDAAVLLQAKIDQIIAVHWDHYRELLAAVDALRYASRTFGFTDSDLEAEFRKLSSA